MQGIERFIQFQGTKYLEETDAIKLLRSNRFLYDYCASKYEISKLKWLGKNPPKQPCRFLIRNLKISKPEHLSWIALYFPHARILSFGSHFDSAVDGHIPEGITEIEFGLYFNQSVNKLPSNLTCLKLGGSFDKEIDCLPQSLTKLDVEDTFNRKIDDLPSGLKTLILGECFTQSIDKLPSNLNSISFGSRFNQCIKRLPPTIQSISFDIRSKAKVSLSDLPHGLLSLELGHNSCSDPPSKWPEGLHTLHLGTAFQLQLHTWPPNLTSLQLGLYDQNDQPIDTLPNGLQFLKVGEYFDQFVAHLPASLETLDMSSCQLFHRDVDCLPPNLKSLLLPDSFNGFIDKLPNSLLELQIGREFNQSIDQLPTGLQSLVFVEEGCFDQSIEHLPSEIRTIELPFSFRAGLYDLPTSLQCLTITTYDYRYSLDALPEQLKELNLSHYYTDCLKSLPQNLQSLRCGIDSQRTWIPPLPPALKLLLCYGYGSVQFDPGCEIEELIIDCRLYGGFPKSLKKLTIESYFGDLVALSHKLPKGLEELVIGRGVNIISMPFGWLPSGLKKLRLVPYCDLSNLPPSLERIEISKSFSHPSLQSIPNSVYVVQY